MEDLTKISARNQLKGTIVDVVKGTTTSPWTSRMDCPRQGRRDGPLCRIELFEPWVEALDGITEFERIEVLYWLPSAA